MDGPFRRPVGRRKGCRLLARRQKSINLHRTSRSFPDLVLRHPEARGTKGEEEDTLTHVCFHTIRVTLTGRVTRGTGGGGAYLSGTQPLLTTIRCPDSSLSTVQMK